MAVSDSRSAMVTGLASALVSTSNRVLCAWVHGRMGAAAQASNLANRPLHLLIWRAVHVEGPLRLACSFSIGPEVFARDPSCRVRELVREVDVIGLEVRWEPRHRHHARSRALQARRCSAMGPDESWLRGRWGGAAHREARAPQLAQHRSVKSGELPLPRRRASGNTADKGGQREGPTRSSMG
jgi:hypothetical protein